MNKKARVIAFYLPQYHPTSDNNKWWGKGFTEWTNVGKAKPLFKGHYQPRVPADLGYYDLRLEEVREEQAKLAEEAGIEGFCYYHYWFGNGKQQLELPFNEVVRLKKPNFPFCLCWANESWHCKFWNLDGSHTKKLLIEQFYLGEEDHKAHFFSLLPAFRDERYIKVNGKLLFMIYKPLEFPEVKKFIHLWNKLAKDAGLNGFHFVGQSINSKDIESILKFDFDAVNIVRLWEVGHKSILSRAKNKIYSKLRGLPRAYFYKDVYPRFIAPSDTKEYIYPTLIPNWDHTPRSGKGGYVLLNSTPELFQEHIKVALEVIRSKEKEKQIIFLKSWNEWGEGNYMEPDLKFGKNYIYALSSLIKEEK